MIISDTNNCPINIKMRSSPICWTKKILVLKTQNRLYHSCSNTAADLWTMNPGVSNCRIFFNRHATCDHRDLWRKTTLRACEQMLSTTLRWNGTRSVCKRAENINYKVRSLRWSMLEEARAAHVCCSPDSLFWEIRSSRHRDGSVWVARVERWREKKEISIKLKGVN